MLASTFSIVKFSTFVPCIMHPRCTYYFNNYKLTIYVEIYVKLATKEALKLSIVFCIVSRAKNQLQSLLLVRDGKYLLISLSSANEHAKKQSGTPANRCVTHNSYRIAFPTLL